RLSTAPAGPTNGSPLRSSRSPGCSPTITTGAPVSPREKTTCVALRYSSQPWQATAARRSSARSAPSGTYGCAEGAVRAAMASPEARWLCTSQHHTGSAPATYRPDGLELPPLGARQAAGDAGEREPCGHQGRPRVVGAPRAELQRCRQFDEAIRTDVAEAR